MFSHRLLSEPDMDNQFEGEAEFRQYLTRVRRLKANTQNSYVSYMNKLSDGNGGHICPGCVYDDRTLAEILDRMVLTEKQHNDLRSAGRAYYSCFKGDGVVRHV